MNKNNASEKFYLLFIEFLIDAKQHLFDMGSAYNLTGMQVITLLLVDKPQLMSNLKATFNCDPSNITGIIDGLEHKHLVERFENAKDRRRKMVQLTTQGHQLRTTLLHTMVNAEGLLPKLTPDEMLTFKKLVRKIHTSNHQSYLT